MNASNLILLPFVALTLVLASAVWVDLLRHRIPNAICFAGAAAGLSAQLWLNGAPGLLSGLGGMAVGLALFLPFYLGRGMGAGDVKLMAAVGAFLGPVDVLLAAGLSLGVGSLFGISILIARRGLLPAVRRYWSSFRCLLTTLQWSYVPPQSGEVAATRFPYAVAIAAGTGLAIAWLADTQRLNLFQAI